MPYVNVFKDNPGLSIIDSPKVLAEIRFRPQDTWIHNPYDISDSSPTRLRVEILLGLDSGYGREHTFTPQFVRRAAMKAFPDGGTIIAQLGWWAGKREASVRLVIMNESSSGAPFPDGQFVRDMNALAILLAEKLRQKYVPVFYFRGERRIGKWTHSLTYRKA